MAITFILLILFPQLLTRVANVVSYAANDYSVDMVFGDSFCLNFVQEDVTNTVKNVCNVTSKLTATTNEQYKAMTTRLDTLETKLYSALHQLSMTSINPCRFGYEYFKEEAFCYRFHSECIIWSEARKVCRQEGGDLISLKESNFNFFREMAQAKSTGCRYVWVGTTDTSSPGTWKWLNGEAISPSIWGPSQPDKQPNEHCGDLKQFASSYSLNDEDCSMKLNFICQIVL